MIEQKNFKEVIGQIEYKLTELDILNLREQFAIVDFTTNGYLSTVTTLFIFNDCRFYFSSIHLQTPEPKHFLAIKRAYELHEYLINVGFTYWFRG